MTRTYLRKYKNHSLTNSHLVRRGANPKMPPQTRKKTSTGNSDLGSSLSFQELKTGKCPSSSKGMQKRRKLPSAALPTHSKKRSAAYARKRLPTILEESSQDSKSHEATTKPNVDLLAQSMSKLDIGGKQKDESPQNAKSEEAPSSPLESHKSYARSKWQHREYSREKDRVVHARQVARNLKRKAKRLTLRGRKSKVENQGEFLPKEDDVLKMLVGSGESQSEKLTALVAIQLSFVGALCVATTPGQYAAATAQLLSGVIGLRGGVGLDKVSKLVEGWWSQPVDEYNPTGEVENQSWLNDLRTTLTNARDGYCSYTTIPVWKQLSRCFVLASMLGLMPEVDEKNASGFLEVGLAKWTKRIETQSLEASFVEVVLSSAIFACDFAMAVNSGTVASMVTPDDVQSRAVSLIAMEDMYRNGTLADIGETSGSYQNNVNKTLSEIKMILRLSGHGSARLIFQRYESELSKIQYRINSSMMNISPRTPAPIICFVGESHVGKTGFVYMTAHFLGKHFGFPTEDKNFWYARIGDKFDSGFTGEKTIIVEDDRESEKEKFTTVEKVAQDVVHCNIVPGFSAQAEISGKGCIPYLHKVKFVTSNAYDVGILEKMRKPEAAFNRNWIYEIEADPQFTDDEGRIDGRKCKGDVLNPNVHRIRAITWVAENKDEDGNGSSFRKKSKLSRNGWRMVCGDWMNTKEFLAHIYERFEYRTCGGNDYLKQIKNIRKVDVCSECLMFKAPGYCTCGEKSGPDHCNTLSVENQAGLIFPAGFDMTTPMFQYMAWCLSLWPDISDYIQGRMCQNGVDYVGSLLIRAFCVACLVCTKSFILACWIMALCIPSVMIFLDYWPRLARYWYISWFVLTWLFGVRLKRIFTRACMREIEGSDPTSRARIMLKVSTLSVTLSTAIFSLYSLRRVFQVRNEGNLQPTTMKEVEERNKEVNPWITVQPQPLPRDDEIANMTHEQACSAIARNLVLITFDAGINTGRTNGLFVCKNACIIPTHSMDNMVKDSPITIERNHSVGGKFVGVYITSITQLPDNDDFSMIIITSAPSFRDIRSFFPDSIYKGAGIASMISRNSDLDLETRTLRYSYSPQVSNESFKGPGSQHLVDVPTRRGLCASPIILKSCPSKIVGLHCGGVRDSKVAVCFSVSRDQVEDALTNIIEARGVINQSYPGDAPFIPTLPKVKVAGKNVCNFKPIIHERDCVNWTREPDMDHPHKMEVFECDPHEKFSRYSDVTVSPLSRFLEHLGRPRLWDKPKFNVNRNFSATYQHAQAPCRDIRPQMMGLLVDDYLRPFAVKIRQLGWKARPLNWKETVNGRANSRFMKRLDMTTASGLGLSSPKSNHFEVDTEPNGRLVYTMKDYLCNEVMAIEKDLADGKVPQCMFKTALKDEPTKITKDKVRVFMVSPLALNLVIRKYLLPIMEFMFAVPFLSEMAQGINCTNEEWDQLGRWLLEFSPQQCVAGDFARFDISTVGQFMRAVGWIFRQLALMLGYTPEEAAICELLLYVVSSKYIVWNGTVVHMDSYTLSGVPITIFLNGIVNALYHRLVFYHMVIVERKNLQHSFRDYVRMMFTGDDSIGSSRLDWYNMKTCQKVLGLYNLVYTDADKSLETVPFYDLAHIQFCKRYFRYESRIGKFVAPIHLESIYKSLHCQMKSITDATDIVVGNVDNALRELARHKKEIFDVESHIIRRACEDAGIAHYCSKLYYNYDQWWEILSEDFPSLRPPNETYVSSVSDGSVDSMES